MENRSKTAMETSAVSILVNLLLSAGKLAAGVAARSGAMISDAAHSASDVFSTVIVMIGIRLAGREADEDHPYGHERLESVAAILLAAVLLATGLAIGWSGVKKILPSGREELAVPGVAALAAALVSILVKEALFWYTRRRALDIGSDALMADAWHHRSDALSSVGALVGIAGARMGFPVLDPLASVVISAFVARAAFQIFRDAEEKLVDHAAAPDTERAIRDRVAGHEGVRSVDLLHTREFGSRLYVELEVGMEGSLPLVEAHAVAEGIHDDIETAFPQVKHVTVHVNPI